MTLPRHLDMRETPEFDAKRIRVTIDGDQPRGIVAFNVDAGWADVLAYDEAGALEWDDHMRGEFKTVRVFGEVVVRWA